MSSILDRFHYIPDINTIRVRCQVCTATNGILVFDMGRAEPIACTGCKRPLWGDRSQGVARIMADTRQGLAEFYEMLVSLEGE